MGLEMRFGVGVCIIYINHLIMSTAPKLTYAKIGNKSKNKIESNSTEMIRHKQQQSQDLFSHMNQDNLNYIKKQLKLKKNRSEHDKPKPNKDEDNEQLQDQITQREKIYHKYKGEEQVSQREPYLEETERKSSQEKPLEIQLSEQAQEEYTQNDGNPSQRKQLSISQKDQHKVFTKNTDNNKMYHSLPYQQPKKRVVSIEGYFRESVSTNLQKFKEDGANFIQFLEDYISDLNHSKHLKSKTHEQSSIQKKNPDKAGKHNKQNLKKSTRRDQTEQQQRLRQNMKNIERFKRNSDTFGEPNSKYTVQSSQSYDTMELEVKLRKEQLSCIMLAKEIEALREALGERDQIIKKLKLNNQLLEEQITHLKTQQEIILKNKTDFAYQSKPNKSQKQTRRTSDQVIQEYDDSTFNKFILSHHRHGSVNPPINNTRNGYSQRGQRNNLREQDLNDYNQPQLFQQFAAPPPQQSSKYKQRQSTPRKNKKSIQKTQKQFEQFMQSSYFIKHQNKNR